VSDEVSRETVGPTEVSEALPGPPSTPAEARRVFAPERLELAERYAQLLATEGVLRGLIGPREAPRLWERHLLNSAVLAEAIPRSATVCDLGSGAGLPGLVVAIARPDLTVTLVEPLLRRTTFLEEVVAVLGLAGVSVVRGRAEDLHGHATFNVVTSRAVAPLDRLLGWSMPLVSPHGSLVAMKGRSAHEEIESARSSLATWRCGAPEVIQVGVGVVSPPTTLVRVSWADPARIGWPLAREAKRRTPRPDRRAARER
jgi:16S rRNA (guanine527-N7)-methyltransferase